MSFKFFLIFNKSELLPICTSDDIDSNFGLFVCFVEYFLMFDLFVDAL